jgi:uncharacterized RDD family membrane protein YckC
MKCPKCSYLSFEPELRCKHCGYDFALAESNLPAHAFDELEQQDPDLPMVDLQLRPAGNEARPAATLGLIRPRPEPSPALRRGAVAVALAVADRDGLAAVKPAAAPTPLAARRAPVAAPAPVPTPTDLPLFIKRGVPATGQNDHAADDFDDPAVQVPAAPRPLVVRRRAPDSGRQASSAAVAAAPALAVNRADRDLLDYLRRVETEAAPAAFPVAAAASAALPGTVTAVTRLQAAAVDVLILAALNVTVVWMTLRQCDLGVSQLASLPILPLATFLVSLSLAYLLVFTVMGGQTIGKMVFGLRVVGDAAIPTARQMSCRALLTVPSVLTLGLGFLPALVGRQGLAVHDRLTHTRVVRA